MLLKADFLLDHFKHTILQGSAAIFIFDQNEVVVSTLDVQNHCLRIAIHLVTLIICELREVINLLLGNNDRIFVVEAGEVDMLMGIVHEVDFVEYLPGNIKLDSLPNHF